MSTSILTKLNVNIPVEVHGFAIAHLFGLISIDYLIEDRRPNIADHYAKYKHYITVRVLWTKYVWVFYTRHNYNYLPFDKNT